MFTVSQERVSAYHFVVTCLSQHFFEANPILSEISPRSETDFYFTKIYKIIVYSNVQSFFLNVILSRGIPPPVVFGLPFPQTTSDQPETVCLLEFGRVSSQ